MKMTKTEKWFNWFAFVCIIIALSATSCLMYKWW